MMERRRSRRRSIPYVRSAVLQVGDKRHIVAVSDLGPEGAFLSTRIEIPPEKPVRLRVVLPRDGREVEIACRVVWRSERFDAATGRPAGIAVRFFQLDPEVARRVEEFAMEGFLPASEPVPADHFEYRILECDALDGEELNRLGRDGWELAAALPAAKGVRLILLRRL